MTKRQDKGQNASDNEFERALFKAVRSANWLLPETEEAVAEEEREFGEGPFELPQRLRDPMAALDPSRRARKQAASSTMDCLEKLRNLLLWFKEHEGFEPECEINYYSDNSAIVEFKIWRGGEYDYLGRGEGDSLEAAIDGIIAELNFPIDERLY